MKLKKQITNARSTARTPSYSGTSTGDWNKPSLGDFGFDSVADMSSADKTDVAEHTLLGDANADTVDELIVIPVVSPRGTLYKSALSNAKARVNQVSGISSDTIDSVKSRCTQLLKDEFDVEYEENTKTARNEKFWSNMDNLALTLKDMDLNPIPFVRKIINNRGANDMSEDLEVLTDNTGFNADELEDLTNEQASEWASVYKEESEEVENNKSEEEQVKNDGEMVTLSKEEVEKLREFKANLEEREKKDKEEAIEIIVANSDYEEEDLEKFSLERLNELKENKELERNDYRGQAGNNYKIESEKVAAEGMGDFLTNKRGGE